MIRGFSSNFNSDEVTEENSSIASEEAPPKILQKMDKLEEFREIAKKYL